MSAASPSDAGQGVEDRLDIVTGKAAVDR